MRKENNSGMKASFERQLSKSKNQNEEGFRLSADGQYKWRDDAWYIWMLCNLPFSFFVCLFVSLSDYCNIFLFTKQYSYRFAAFKLIFTIFSICLKTRSPILNVCLAHCNLICFRFFIFHWKVSYMTGRGILQNTELWIPNAEHYKTVFDGNNCT